MSQSGDSGGPGWRSTRAWSAVSIALTFTLVVGGLALVVNVILVNLEPFHASVLRYDLTADILLATVAGLVLYGFLRREAVSKRRAAELLQREEEAEREQARIQAHEAERSRLIQIMDTIPQGVCIISEDHEMDYVNPVLQRTFGPAEGRKCYEYLDGRTDPCPWCPNAEVFAGQTVRREWVGHDNGRTYELVDTPMPSRAGKRFKLEMLNDVTEDVEARKRTGELMVEVARQAEEARIARADAEEHAEELEALLDISRALTSTLQSKPLIDLILRVLKQVVDYSNVILSMVEDESLVIVAFRGPDVDSFVLGRRVPLRDAPGFCAVRDEGKPLIVPDLRADTPLVQAMRLADDPLVRGSLLQCNTWMGVPLFAHDRLVGFLRLAHVRSGYYTERHAELALAIAACAAIALENARLYEEAHKVATLEERQRMAGELHDSVSQALYGIALGTHAAREQLEQAPEKLPETLDYVLSLSETAVTEMRSLVFELHPESLKQLGLASLLTKLVETVRARDNLFVQLDLCSEPDVSLEVKEMLYRIAQEALGNVAKHAGAGVVDVCMRCKESCVELQVGDDGVGFDTTAQFPGHYGLQSMAARAARLGGSLTIDSAPGKGTRVTAQVPLATTLQPL